MTCDPIRKLPQQPCHPPAHRSGLTWRPGAATRRQVTFSALHPPAWRRCARAASWPAPGRPDSPAGGGGRKGWGGGRALGCRPAGPGGGGWAGWAGWAGGGRDAGRWTRARDQHARAQHRPPSVPAQRATVGRAGPAPQGPGPPGRLPPCCQQAALQRPWHSGTEQRAAPQPPGHGCDGAMAPPQLQPSLVQPSLVQPSLVQPSPAQPRARSPAAASSQPSTRSPAGRPRQRWPGPAPVSACQSWACPRPAPAP
jgi:hypothetical protein